MSTHWPVSGGIGLRCGRQNLMVKAMSPSGQP